MASWVKISFILIAAWLFAVVLASAAHASEPEVLVYQVEDAYPDAMRDALREWRHHGAQIRPALPGEQPNLIFRRYCRGAGILGVHAEHPRVHVVKVNECAGLTKPEMKGTYVHEVGHALGIERHLRRGNVLGRSSLDAPSWHLQRGDLRAFRRVR